MLELEDFKKLTKSTVLNVRFITGGDDWHVGFSGYVLRGGTKEKDPKPYVDGFQAGSLNLS